MPDYYFRNKIPFGFLWGAVGFFLARKIDATWLQAAVLSVVVAVTLQIRYFLEGYSFDFVLLFLWFHFIILYALSIVMFRFLKRRQSAAAKDRKCHMKKIIIALLVVAIVGIATYYTVFAPAPPGNKLPADATVKAPPAQAPAAAQTAPTPDVSAVTVRIRSFSFNPSTLSVKVGTKVTWVNEDAASHTVTSDNGEVLNSPSLPTGQSYSATFSTVGSISYHCGIHPGMKGQITITD